MSLLSPLSKKHRLEYQREYRRRPEVKAKEKAYAQRPEVRARALAYQKRPDIKAQISSRDIIARKARRSIYIEYKEWKCAVCGLVATTENACVFQFHHRNPDEKEFDIGSTSISLERALSELDKCDMLCANCHLIIHLGGNQDV